MTERPEHVMETATGHVCKHCGGRVADDGFAEGGLVDSGEFESPYVEGKEAEQREPEEDMHTEQQDYTELLRERAHETPERPPEAKPDSDGSDLETRRKKHYSYILGGK